MRKAINLFTLLLFFAVTIFISSCSKEYQNLDDASSPENAIGLTASFTTNNHFVYTMNNDVDANSILAFDRNSDGTLNDYVATPTGGAGTGTGLGSQGSIVDAGNFLIVVNAGSNQVSVLRKSNSGALTLVDIESSAGERPTSVTVHNNLVYVMNTGGVGNIAGFTLNNQGDLTYLEGSNQPFSTDTSAPAQISFNPRGDFLVVTERATNVISVYEVDDKGIAGQPTSYATAGQTPFGFDWGIHGEILVSEAFGGAPGASTVSSYNLNKQGGIELIEGPVPTNQSAACWVITTKNGKYAYTTNTASATVSGYNVAPTGEIDLLDDSGVSGVTGAGPIDASVNNSSKYLYTLNAGSDSITIFEINNDGSLSLVNEVEGLPNGSAGLIAN